MKKKYSLALLALSATLLSSCGINTLSSAVFKDYMKDEALIETENNTQLFFDKQIKYDTKLEAFNDYYKMGNNQYKSFFSDKIIEAPDGFFKSFKVGDFDVYYNKKSQKFYDAFGSEVPLLRVDPNLDHQVIKYKIIASECSNFYKKISGKRSNSQRLHLINASKVTLASDSISSVGYILTEEGDTHFKASNYWIDLSSKKRYDFDFSNRDYLLPETTEIVKLNEFEWLINGKDRYSYKRQDIGDKYKYSPEIVREREKSRSVTGKTMCLISHRFAGTNELYQYFIKEFDKNNRPEYFTFVEDGKYYQTYIYKNGEPKEVDYVPVLPQDPLKPLGFIKGNEQHLFLKVRKIKDKMIDIIDSDYYMIHIDNSFTRSNFSKDLSFLSDTSTQYFFHDTYHKMPNDYKIYLLNKEALILNSGKNYVFINNKGGINDLGYYYNLIASPISYDHYYFFFSKSSRGARLYMFDAKNNFVIDPISQSNESRFYRPPEKGEADYVFKNIVATILASYINPSKIEVNELRECRSFNSLRQSFIYSDSIKKNNVELRPFGYYLTYKTK